jgi:DNA-binding transcriptional regulator LsrR (DeoR family)
MPAFDDLSPDEFELLARIAHRYYVDGMTQEALAREFSLSRPKVQRLLERARTTKVVDIRIATPPWLHLDLEQALCRRFGLADVIVASARPDPAGQRDEVARAAARFLERRLGDGAVVAVSHGRDTGEVPRHFRPAQRPQVTFVSAMGGSPLADSPTNPNAIVRSLAERSGGQAVELFAPASVESVEMRDQLLRQPAVAEALRMAAGASMALIGIGGTDDACTMVRTGCFSLEEIRRLRLAGAVGDMLGNYVDVSGGRLESAETARIVGLSIEELHAIETVVAVVSENEKPFAILGALRTGVIDVLVVDEGNARFLLDVPRDLDVRPSSEV